MSSETWRRQKYQFSRIKMEETSNLKEMISNMRVNLRKALDCRSIATGRRMKNMRLV